MERTVVCFALLISGMMKTTTADACLINTMFGNNCAYQCHCAGNEPCNPVNGSCPNGCASGWEGEYCQLGNAAAGKSSRANQSSTDSTYSASLALDGKTDQDFPSCSHTQEEYQPWWQVDLGKDYVVFAVKIWNVHHFPGDSVTMCRKTDEGEEYRGTISKTKDNDACRTWGEKTKSGYPVTAGSENYCRNPDNGKGPWCYTGKTDYAYCDIPMCEGRLSNFNISLDNQRCHHYTGTVANGGSPEIRCDSPVVGRYLKIQLLGSTFLSLCEVSVTAFQYRACQNKHYGPNCNNQCQCKGDAECDDKTGKCPSEECNDRFTGHCCNIEIPVVSVYGPSTPTSISVRWPYIRPHDSAYDVVNLSKYYVVYKQESIQKIIESPASKGTMNANLTGLLPSTDYSIGLKIEYSVNGRVFKSLPGPMTTIQTHSCQDYLVSPVITVVANKIDTDSSWALRAVVKTRIEVPGMLTDCIGWFNVYYKAIRDTGFKRNRKDGSDTCIAIERLMPFTEYDLIPSVESPDGKVKNGTSIKVTTAEDVPPAPSVRKSGASSRSISVTVVPPNPSYGVITHYDLEMSKGWTGVEKTIELKPSDLSYTFDKLELKTTYGFRARAFTSEGAGAWSRPITIITEESIPGPPNILEVTERTTNRLKLIWTEPKYESGVLLDYKVICTPLYSYDEDVNAKRGNYTKEANTGPDVTQLVVTGLTPATEYNCSVAAHTSKGYGPSVWVRNWTKPEAANVPDNLLPNVSPDQVTDSTITVHISKMPMMSKTGAVSKLHIAVEKVDRAHRKWSIPMQADEYNLLTDHDSAREKGYPGYIAAELAANFSGPFVIGDGKTYGGYYNAPLEGGQSYDVIFGMVFTVGDQSTVAYRRYGWPIAVQSGKTSPVGPEVWIYVGVAVGVLVILTVVITSVVVTVKRRRRRKAAMPTYEQPIPMNATSQNEDVYDELETSNDQATYYNIPPANTNQALYENVAAGGKKGSGARGNVAVVRDEDYENPCVADEADYEDPNL